MIKIEINSLNTFKPNKFLSLAILVGSMEAVS